MKERVPEYNETQDHLVPLIGRREEANALAAALDRPGARLISGPSGIGKTRLIQEALSISPLPTVCLQGPDVLHELLVKLAERLSCPAGRFADLRHATSVALKPVVLEALGRAPHCVVLEDVAAVDPRMYRFLQQVRYVPSVCLIVTAKSRECLGYLRKLLWNPREETALKPLSRREALALFEAASRRFRLENLDVEEFRSRVLTAALGNPGQILTMCRMAGRPEYQDGRHIKFSPLRIDSLTAFLS